MYKNDKRKASKKKMKNIHLKELTEKKRKRNKMKTVFKTMPKTTLICFDIEKYLMTSALVL